MKFPNMDPKSFIPSDSPRKSLWLSPRIGRSRIGGCSQFLISSRKIDSSICGWKNEFSIFFGKDHLSHWVFFWVDFRCVHRLQLLLVCNQYVTLPNSPAYKAYPRNNPGKTFFPNWWILDWSFAEIGYYSTNEPNGMIGPLNGFPKRLTYKVFPTDMSSWIFRR